MTSCGTAIWPRASKNPKRLTTLVMTRRTDDINEWEGFTGMFTGAREVLMERYILFRECSARIWHIHIMPSVVLRASWQGDLGTRFRIHVCAIPSLLLPNFCFPQRWAGSPHIHIVSLVRPFSSRGTVLGALSYPRLDAQRVGGDHVEVIYSSGLRICTHLWSM